MSMATALVPPASQPGMAVGMKVRAEDFLKMDLGDALHELVDGEVIEVPPPRPKHGLVCLSAGSIFRDFGRRTGHGYALSNDSVVVLGEWDVRGADIQYFSEARWPKSQVGDQPPPVPPDLVVEVLSPSNRQYDVLRKVSDYLKGGVSVVLILNPADETLTVYRGDTLNPVVLGRLDYLEKLPELPDFQCQVSEFFS